jgi:uncharacterized integral membrane protein (TIGR00697 family)
MEVLLGTIVFSSSFLACDMINMEYGAEKARQAVYLTVLTDIFFLLNIMLTLGHQTIDYAKYPNFSIPKEAIEMNVSSIKQIFLPGPRLLVASYTAYLFSQLSEIWLLNLFEKVQWIKSRFAKHNLSLFISNICIDTIVFTSIGMCFLSNQPLSFKDIKEISISAIAIRFFCNIGNIIFLKTLKPKLEK